jgi:hypothetical protein
LSGGRPLAGPFFVDHFRLKNITSPNVQMDSATLIMNIPKARFLKQSYLKNKTNIDKKARIEAILIRSILTNILRNPQTHKAGALSQFFDINDFPLLTRGAFPEHIFSVRKDFEDAGYLVNIEPRHNGLVITLDWRDVESGEDI